MDANDQLVEINKAGQKLFTSCEIHPNFARGQGLSGGPRGDRHAGLARHRASLKFAAMPRPNVFSPAHETAIEQSSDGVTIAEATKSGIIAVFDHIPASGYVSIVTRTQDDWIEKAYGRASHLRVGRTRVAVYGAITYDGTVGDRFLRSIDDAAVAVPPALP